MSNSLIWLTVGVVVLAAALLLGGRYTMAADGQYSAWRVDTLTGAVTFCGIVDRKLSCIPVKEVEPPNPPKK
jgi:hypothetical protein